MNNRRSARLDNHPPRKKGYGKQHIVCVLNMNLLQNAANWVANKNQEYANYHGKASGNKLTPVQISELPYYQLMDFCQDKTENPKSANYASSKLASIPNDTVLYLYCHGYIENMVEPDLALQINLKNANSTVIEFSATDLFKFLKRHQLSSNHQVLKIAACYSEKFAQEFSEISCGLYPDMLVCGYYGELIVNQKNNYKYAGLLQDSGYIYWTDVSLYSIIHKGKLEISQEMMHFYRASQWRYTYKNGALFAGPQNAGVADPNGYYPIPNRKPKKHKSSADVVAEAAEDNARSVAEEKTVSIKTDNKRVKTMVSAALDPLIWQGDRVAHSDSKQVEISLPENQKHTLFASTPMLINSYLPAPMTRSTSFKKK